ncbi:hypothetical protein [Sphingorhabdus sp. YGSMI21]|uniref:hypothetical protein n=1 Tax=Sphingorhabdus sp. YGSMI21 TaxID=2077182 RepID=UPI000C1F3F07|nr:hypothetical protein [Sphingorhabdus sp. YGSMI21]ATW03577.1 hypothetical protein CHN51_08550 [Sphingorhabdus sp. YGSMI21]
MGLFGPKSPLDTDEWDWQLASFKWLIMEFGGIERHPANRLVLPEESFFPKTSTDPSRKAQEIFEQVKMLAGMGDWPTRLVQGDQTREMVLESGQMVKHDSHAPAGEYRLLKADDGEYYAQISFNPAQLGDPTKLIATFAHELSHYLMSTAKTAPPGGWEVHELTTDLCSVYLGFGIFMATSAWNFAASNEGWQYERQGYLNERMLITAMVIWETLAKRDPLEALPYLKPHLAKDTKMANKFVQKRDLLDELMSTDLSLFAGGETAAEDSGTV